MTEMTSKARKGVGLIWYLCKYLSGLELKQIYKLHVQHQLGYGDICVSQTRFRNEARFYKKVRASPILSSTFFNRSMAGDKQ